MSTTDSQRSGHTTAEALLPDHKKISDAFAILSQELPRVSNLDTNGVIQILENLRAEVKENLQVQRRFTDDLDARLTKVQESLDSLNKRLDSFGPSLVMSRPHADSRNNMDNARVEVYPVLVDKEEYTTSDPHQVPPRLLPPTSRLPETKTRMFQGPSGALIIIIASMIPILIALYWPGVLE